MGTLDGNHPAKNGTIDLDILKTKIKGILPTFPEEGAGLQAVKAAKLLKTKNLANLTVQTANSRPSTTLIEKRKKSKKQADKQDTILQKSLEKDRLAQFKFTFQPNPAASPKTAVREKVGDLYDKRLEKQCTSSFFECIWLC